MLNAVSALFDSFPDDSEVDAPQVRVVRVLIDLCSKFKLQCILVFLKTQYVRFCVLVTICYEGRC
jgi:hypothetical protein